MDKEPSVLDYIKSKLTPWKGETVEIPESGSDEAAASDEVDTIKQVSPIKIPWRSLAALGLALIAQATFEPRPERTWVPGTVFYLAAAIAAVWAVLKNEMVIAEHREPEWVPDGENPKTSRLDRVDLIGIAVLFSTAAVLLFGNKETGQYQFTEFNLFAWLAALIVMILAVYLPAKNSDNWVKHIWQKISQKEWSVHFSWWNVLFLAVLALGVFFRFTQLNSVPGEMVSDHAEKLLDVSDVLNGQYNTYFSRNTGREFFQFYWTALMVLLFGQGISFLSLKLGTVILGVLTMPFIYLIGKELGSKRAGMLAMAFAGIAYWPNLISRIALRFTLYPFFYAPTLYFFLRGMRRMRRSDFILSGIFLGLGLHGYSPSRIVPLLLVLALVLFLLHRPGRVVSRQAVIGLIVVALISLVVFLPLLRYTIDNPEMVGYRALTRLGNVEQPLQDSAGKIFLTNLWRAMTMFAWDNGEVWVISLTHRPVLDIVSGALYHLGTLLVLIRYIRKRHWIDLFMLISVIVLMLPSILSLAFPGENPSLNRTAAAIIPAFLFIGYALDGIMTAVERAGKNAIRWSWLIAAVLLLFSALQNYEMVFVKYKQVYQMLSWNTSDMGKVARAFSDSVGSVDTTYLVAYPYWADSRLVAIAAGYPTRDFALWPENFEATTADPRAKMFIINSSDIIDTEALQKLYPQGVLYNYDVFEEGKDFWLFYVPPDVINSSP